VTVAVLDGGVDSSAPGLAGVVTTGPSFGNVAGDALAEGTLFASAVAGRGPSGSNPAGPGGLAPATRILSIKIPNRAASGTWQHDIGAAIRYAASHGAQVIYVSEESFRDDAALDSAVEYAAARNAVVISPEFIFRNAPSSESTVPDSLPGVLGAASVVLPGLPKPPHGMRYPANESILVTAPANVLTVSGPRGQGYEMFDSLSSAAWLTATVALIKSVYPHLPDSLVDQAIAQSARDHPKGGYSKQAGFGLINPDGALHQAAALAKVPVTAPAGSGSLAVSARFAPGPAPGVIDAVHHSTTKLTLAGAAMVAALLLLVIAAALALRWRSRPA
jgi:Subtilase family